MEYSSWDHKSQTRLNTIFLPFSQVPGGLNYKRTLFNPAYGDLVNIQIGHVLGIQ